VAISTAARDQCNPVVANNGSDYLAIWTDYRDGANYAIYGAKITAASVLANPASFRISSSAGDHYHPAVAQGASGYWIAWQDYRSGGSSDIYGSRLTTAGAVSDPSGVLLSVLGGSVPPQVPTITWGQPANIVYGTLLSGSQLNASANVPGTFQYSPPSGTVLGAGNNQILAVIFTPTDTQTYSSASATVTINVSQVPLTIRADNKAKIAGQPNPTLTATYTGFVNADTSVSLSSPVVLTTTATTASPAGSYPIIASGAVGANYVISFVNGILTVTSPTLTGLTVQPATAAIAVGQTQPFTATAAYSDGSTAVVTSSAAWQSSNPSVATVNNPGSAKGVGAGTAIISASLGGLTASGSLTVTGTTHDVAKTFKNSKTIRDPSGGSSSPYPSGITVSGFNGTIREVTVKLMHLHASRANNVNLLLVGPAGQQAVLMSGAGGRRELSGVNVTLDDAAPSLLPQYERISSGSYRPAHYATGFVFRAPAPSGPYTADLSIFNGTAPNGVWKLYLQDSQSREEAALEDGWSLTITASSADHGSDDDESD
jgi:hypothetical protein